MKLFGTRFRRPEEEPMDDLPIPQDKTPLRDQAPDLSDIDDEEFEEMYGDEEYDEEYDDEYDEYDEDDYEYEDDEDEDGTPMWKPMLISFIVCLVVFVGAAALIVNYFLNLINYQSADSDYFATVEAPEELVEETYEDSYLEALDEADTADDLEASPEDLQRWNDHIDTITSDDSTFQVPISSDVYNILLIGTDNRSVGAVGRSDVMMLVSINHKTETIYLTSFLRDCYVSIPGYGKTRLNHSFAYGGPDLLMETLLRGLSTTARFSVSISRSSA